MGDEADHRPFLLCIGRHAAVDIALAVHMNVLDTEAFDLIYQGLSQDLLARRAGHGPAVFIGHGIEHDVL